MKRAGRFARALWVALSLCAMMAAPAARAAEPGPASPATAPPAVVRIVPPAAIVEPGGLVTATIVITDVAGLYGADVRLTFDPALVQVVDADGGRAGTQITPGPLLTEQGTFFEALNEAKNVSGTIAFAGTMINPAVPITGGGVLALIQFRGVLTGVTPLAIFNAELATKYGATLSRTLENGQISVLWPNRFWLPRLER